jgi:hypothetical protein
MTYSISVTFSFREAQARQTSCKGVARTHRGVAGRGRPIEKLNERAAAQAYFIDHCNFLSLGEHMEACG